MAEKRSGPSRGGPKTPSRGGSRSGPSRGGPSRGGPSRDSGRGGPRSGGDRPSFGDRSRSSAPRGDRPSFSDRPKRDFGDRPQRSFDDRPPRGDRPSFSDRPKRDFGDRPRGDRPSYNDRPKRDFGDRPERGTRSYESRPPRDSGRDDRGFEDRAPKRDRDMPFEDRPRRSFQREGFGASRKRDDMNTERPKRDFGDRPSRGFSDKRDDRPQRDYGDRPAPRGRSFDDRGPKRDYGDRKPAARAGFEKRDSRSEYQSHDQSETPMKGHEMLIYGVHAAQAALRNKNRTVTKVWVSDTGAAHLEGAFDDKRHPQPEEITRREIENKLPAGAVHQGIALAVEPLDDVFLSDILTSARSTDDRQVVVVLDEVTDPHNVGAVLRSMSMFGAKAMIVHKRNAPSITGVMAKIATGAIEHVPMVPVTNLAQAMEELKIAGFYCLGLDEHATISIDQAPKEGHIALILGNEGEGLRAKTRSTCDAITSIEGFGEIKSLNVSNAAAITLYAVTRKA